MPEGCNVFVSGLDAGIDVVGGKWKVLVLWALGSGPRRFGELRRAVDGVSEKVLAQHLRELERDEVVRREAHDTVPPRVEYSLTPSGTALVEALRPLGAWGCEHRTRLEEIRGSAVCADAG